MQPEFAHGPTMLAQDRWKSVLYGAPVDSDIEMLISTLQKKHGYTRQKASAELVRRLSQAVS